MKEKPKKRKPTLHQVEKELSDCRAKQREFEAKLLRIKEMIELSEKTQKGVTALIRLASEGDGLVIETLVSIASETVFALNALAKQRPEEVREIAKSNFMWPVMISRKREHKRWADEILDLLQVGEGSIISTRPWQPSSLSTKAAWAHFMAGKKMEKMGVLPSLTPENKKEWFDYVWNSLIALGIEPEKMEVVCDLGKSAIKKPNGKSQRGMPEQTEGMKACDMRAEIKRQLWRAFDGLIAGKSGAKK